MIAGCWNSIPKPKWIRGCRKPRLLLVIEWRRGREGDMYRRTSSSANYRLSHRQRTGTRSRHSPILSSPSRSARNSKSLGSTAPSPDTSGNAPDCSCPPRFAPELDNLDAGRTRCAGTASR